MTRPIGCSLMYENRARSTFQIVARPKTARSETSTLARVRSLASASSPFIFRDIQGAIGNGRGLIARGFLPSPGLVGDQKEQELINSPAREGKGQGEGPAEGQSKRGEAEPGAVETQDQAHGRLSAEVASARRCRPRPAQAVGVFNEPVQQRRGRPEQSADQKPAGQLEPETQHPTQRRGRDRPTSEGQSGLRSEGFAASGARTPRPPGSEPPASTAGSRPSGHARPPRPTPLGESAIRPRPPRKSRLPLSQSKTTQAGQARSRGQGPTFTA